MQPTVATALKIGRQTLKKYQLSAPLEAEILLSKILKKDKIFFYTHPERKLTLRQYRLYQQLLQQRRAGRPIAYLIGEKEFYNLKFCVNEEVLIPRPETEILVENCLAARDYLAKKFPGQTINILDIGTGAGCIIISLAKTLTHQGGYFAASDLSAKAIQLARKNARRLKTAKINFYQGDLLSPFPRSAFRPPVIIAANLPYLTKISQNLKFEPRQALLGGGRQGLKIYQRLLQQIAQEKICGVIFLEIDPSQAAAIKKLAKNILANSESKIIKDLSGRQRIIAIKMLNFTAKQPDPKKE